MSKAKRTAVVTGAGSGIGKATALRFAAGGFQLILCDRDGETLNATAKEVHARRASAELVLGDVSQENTAAKVAEAARGLGGPDVLVNAAGLHHLGDIDEVSLEDWNQVIAINLTSMFLMCRAVIPLMLERGERSNRERRVRLVVRRPGDAGQEYLCLQRHEGGCAPADDLPGYALCGTGNSRELRVPGGGTHGHDAEQGAGKHSACA